MATFLFVHGVYHGPECWAGVIAQLEEHGHRCTAIALRGHSPETRHHFDFRGVRFSDYLTDVKHALTLAGPEAILVGHSLGAMLVRRLMEERALAGAVLVSMPTPSALRRAGLKLLRRFPGPMIRFLLTGRPEEVYHHPDILPLLFWSQRKEHVGETAWLATPLQYRESLRLFIEVQWLRFHPPQPGTPCLVIGGTNDYSLPEASFEMTARDCACPLALLDGAPHDLMLTHAARVAEELTAFTRHVLPLRS